MTSLYGSKTRQVSNDAGYYIPVGDNRNGVSAVLADGVTLSTAAWGAAAAATCSTIVAGGGILKDMGKTHISAGRTFRKIQVVRTGAAFNSTFGVGGDASTAPNQDYLTGYLELGFEGTGSPAKVALFGR